MRPSLSTPERVRETRIWTVNDLEIREAGDNALQFTGHAAVFNQLSEPMFGFREQVAPGAFTKTIQENDDVRLLINHRDLPLARTKSGTLVLTEDKVGLYTEAQLERSDPDVQRLEPKMRRKDVDQMSFGFRVVRDEWDESDPDNVIRTLLEVRLFDTSVVTFPAYPQTTAEVRARMREIHGGALEDDWRDLDDAMEVLARELADRELPPELRDRARELVETIGRRLPAPESTESPATPRSFESIEAEAQLLGALIGS